jgi:MFS family permease
MAGSIVGVTGGILAMSLFPKVALVIPLMGVLSFSISSLMGRISQTIQEHAPPELRGRVMGVFSIAFSGVMPFAALGISALSDRVGYPRVMQGASAIFFVAGLTLVARAWRPLADMRPAPAAGAAREQPASS